MYTRKLTFVALLIITMGSHAQILPQPGSKLNYNQIMFEYEKIKGAHVYVVQVVEGTSMDAFNHISAEQKDSATATRTDNLKFGKTYQWRYAGITGNEKPIWHGPYSFEIVKDSMTEKHLLKLVVTENDSAKNAGGLIINDASHTIVDRHGRLVWYLPTIKWNFSITEPTKTVNGILIKTKSIAISPGVTDLRLTPFGTITCLADSDVAERDLNGNVLWRPPHNSKVSGFGGESYNHDFKRLPNGHYMILGNELWQKLPSGSSDTIPAKKRFGDRELFNGMEYAKVEYGTVIEYDKQGNVVWSWNSQNYFEHDPLRPRIRNQRIEYPLKPHINAFSVDDKNEFVYVGFRDISRIVKVEKSTGKVVDSWGLRLYLGGAKHSVELHQQHDANILNDGNIAVFNSNDYPGSDSIPGVLIISQQPDSGKIVWRYDCELDSVGRRANRNGGNVDQLKNGNLLVCTGTSDRIFEITKDKKIVWQMDVKSTSKDSVPYAYRLYRAHYTSSLYPNYFVFVTDKDTVSKLAPGFNIRLFNKGSENDSYDVKISSTSGQFNKQLSTDALAPNRSATFNIQPGEYLKEGDRMGVIISSRTNPDNIRRSWIEVQ